MAGYFVAFMEDLGGDRAWLTPPETVAREVTIDGEAWIVAVLDGDDELAFWAAYPEGFDVRWCGRGATREEVFDLLDVQEHRDMWEDLNIPRSRKPITAGGPI